MISILAVAVVLAAGLATVTTMDLVGATGTVAEAGMQPVDQGAVPLDCGPRWVGAWNASPVAIPTPMPGLGPVGGRTLRMIVRPQVGGSEIRLRLSNRYGATALAVGSVTIGKAAGAAWVENGSLLPVTFGGAPSVTVPAGTESVSDPVGMPVGKLAPLAVSVFLLTEPSIVTGHPLALQTSYLSGPGDHASATDGLAFGRQLGSWLVLTGVEVWTARSTNAVLLVGDSIADGLGSRPGANQRWSDQLAERLNSAGGDAEMSVLNAGISRNRMLDGAPFGEGDPPSSRFAWDVMGQAGLTDVVLNEGTNDIEQGSSAEEIISGIRVFADQARAAGLRVFLTTITPSTNGKRATAAGVATRKALNAWLLGDGAEHATAVFDLGKAVANPLFPNQLAAPFDSGDGLHLSDAGYQAMADGVNVGLLSGSPCLADGVRSAAQAAR